MVAGYHLIWTAYGWWLPNDPRGSSSHTVRVEAVAALGELHHGRKRVQPPRSELQLFFERSREALAHRVYELTADETLIVAEAFAAVMREQRYTCYACAILPEHVHLLIRKHWHWAETMIERLQRASRAALIAAGRRPGSHPVWGGPGWKVFLNTQADMVRIVDYIGRNPLERGLPRQDWPFVAPYDGWLPRGGW